MPVWPELINDWYVCTDSSNNWTSSVHDFLYSYRPIVEICYTSTWTDLHSNSNAIKDDSYQPHQIMCSLPTQTYKEHFSILKTRDDRQIANSWKISRRPATIPWDSKLFNWLELQHSSTARSPSHVAQLISASSTTHISLIRLAIIITNLYANNSHNNWQPYHDHSTKYPVCVHNILLK